MNNNFDVLIGYHSIDDIVVGIFNWLNYQDKDYMIELIEYLIPKNLIEVYTSKIDMYRGMAVDSTKPLRELKYCSWSECAIVCSRFRDKESLYNFLVDDGSNANNIVSQLYYKNDHGFMLTRFIGDLIKWLRLNENKCNYLSWDNIEELTNIDCVASFNDFFVELSDEQEVLSNFNPTTAEILDTKSLN